MTSVLARCNGAEERKERCGPSGDGDREPGAGGTIVDIHLTPSGHYCTVD